MCSCTWRWRCRMRGFARINTRPRTAVHKKCRYGCCAENSAFARRSEIQFGAGDGGERILTASSRSVDLVGGIGLQRQRAIQETGDVTEFKVGFARLGTRKREVVRGQRRAVCGVDL